MWSGKAFYGITSVTLSLYIHGTISLASFEKKFSYYMKYIAHSEWFLYYNKRDGYYLHFTEEKVLLFSYIKLNCNHISLSDTFVCVRLGSAYEYALPAEELNLCYC